MKKTMEKDSSDKDASTESARLTHQKLYTELGSDDVLLGRGTGPNEFEGNIRFRRLVGEVAMATDPKGLLSNKPVLARRVVDEVTNRGGRFVRKLSKGEVLALASIAPINKRKDLYVEVPHAVAIEKAKQSFRHQEKIILDRREDPSRAKKGVIGGASGLKSPPTISIKDDALLPPPDRHSRGVTGIKPKDDVEKRSKVGSSTITTDHHISETQHPSIETMPLRTEHGAVSLPSSFMDFSNIMSQSHALQALSTDTTSLLLSAQQQSSGPHNTNNMGALASAFPLLRHGILDPSSLLYAPQVHTFPMELLNEVSRRHDLASLLGSSVSRSVPLSSTPQENRISDVATQLHEQQQSQASASLLQLLQEYYPPLPVSSLSSRGTTTSLSAPLPPPPWSSALLQNNLALGLIGGGAGGGLAGGPMDFSLSSSILQQQQQQQQRQILLASLGGTLGLGQESSGESVAGPSGLQQAISSSGGGEGGALESGTDSLLAAARMVTTAPAPLSDDGTNDGSRWPLTSSDHDDSSTPAAETERNNVVSDQQQQAPSLLEYILRLRRP